MRGQERGPSRVTVRRLAVPMATIDRSVRLPAMRVLVTGSSGFVGSAVAESLLERGDEVVGWSRRECEGLVRRGMRSVRGDLADRQLLDRNVRDLDAVIHTAAMAGVWGAASRYRRANVDTTLALLSACQRASVPRMVFTSSPSVTFSGVAQDGVDESVGYANRFLCAYPRTKAEAEQAVLASSSKDLATVALRPHLVWGVDDPHLLPRVVQRARTGRLTIAGDGENRIDCTHIDNVAAAHLDALDTLVRSPQRCAGKAYFISNDEPVVCRDWLERVCRAAGVTCRLRCVPFGLAYALGGIAEAAHRALRVQREPRLTRFVAAQLALPHHFDISAAKRDLGYYIRTTMDEGFEKLARAWKEPR